MTRHELRVELDTWMCGCGLPHAAARFLHDVLQTYAVRAEASAPLSLFKPEDRLALERVWNAESSALKVLLPTDGLFYFVLYVLSDWELLEHGSSVGGSWLTDKGKAVYAALHAEEPDGFHALLDGVRCVHGYDIEETCPECVHDR
jgi:hypothetical protein